MNGPVALHRLRQQAKGAVHTLLPSTPVEVVSFLDIFVERQHPEQALEHRVHKASVAQIV